jgi:hypothetical protein
LRDGANRYGLAVAVVVVFPSSPTAAAADDEHGQSGIKWFSLLMVLKRAFISSKYPN